MSVPVFLAVFRGFPKATAKLPCDERAYLAMVDTTAEVWLRKRVFFVLLVQVLLTMRFQGGFFTSQSYAHLLSGLPQLLMPFWLALALNFLPAVKKRGLLAVPFAWLLVNAHRLLVVLGVRPSTIASQQAPAHELLLALSSSMVIGWGVPLPLYHHLPLRLAFDVFHCLYTALGNKRQGSIVPVHVFRYGLSASFAFICDLMRRKAFIQCVIAAANGGVKSKPEPANHQPTIHANSQDASDCSSHNSPHGSTGAACGTLAPAFSLPAPLPKLDFAPSKPYKSRFPPRRTVIKVPDVEPDIMPHIDLEDVQARVAQWDPSLHVKHVFVRRGCIVLDLDMVQLPGGQQGEAQEVQLPGGQQGEAQEVQARAVAEILQMLNLHGMTGSQSTSAISQKTLGHAPAFLKFSGGSWAQLEGKAQQESSHSLTSPVSTISRLQPICIALPEGDDGAVHLSAHVDTAWRAGGGCLEAVVAGKAFPVSIVTAPSSQRRDAAEFRDTTVAVHGMTESAVDLQVTGLAHGTPGLLHLDQWSGVPPKYLLGTQDVLLLPAGCQAAAQELCSMAAAAGDALSEGFEAVLSDLGQLLEATNSMTERSSTLPSFGRAPAYLAELQLACTGLMRYAQEAGCYAVLELVQQRAQLLSGLGLGVQEEAFSQGRLPSDSRVSSGSASGPAFSAGTRHTSCGSSPSGSAVDQLSLSETRAAQARLSTGTSGRLLMAAAIQTVIAWAALQRCSRTDGGAHPLMFLTIAISFWPYPFILLAAAANLVCRRQRGSAAAQKLHSMLSWLFSGDVGLYLQLNKLFMASLICLELLPCQRMSFQAFNLAMSTLHAATIQCRTMAVVPIVVLSNALLWYQAYRQEAVLWVAVRQALTLGLGNGAIQLIIGHLDVVKWHASNQGSAQKAKQKAY